MTQCQSDGQLPTWGEVTTCGFLQFLPHVRIVQTTKRLLSSLNDSTRESRKAQEYQRPTQSLLGLYAWRAWNKGGILTPAIVTALIFLHCSLEYNNFSSSLVWLWSFLWMKILKAEYCLCTHLYFYTSQIYQIYQKSVNYQFKLNQYTCLHTCVWPYTFKSVGEFELELLSNIEVSKSLVAKC